MALIERLIKGALSQVAAASKPSSGRTASKPTTAAAPSVPPPALVDPELLFVLPSGALLGIAGESFHQEAVAAAARSGAKNPSGLSIWSDVADDVATERGRDLRWFEAQLRPMPDNPYDSNAIAVLSPHGHVGYLPRAQAAEYAGIFESLGKLGYAGAACPAFVDVDKGCVVIALSWPSFCDPEINEERRKRAWEAWEAGEDLDAAASRLGYDSAAKLLTAARKRAKERGLEMPPTASMLERKGQ
ncbi:MAG: HIRAN domain-containing protein [Gaiellaceae bacterium]